MSCERNLHSESKQPERDPNKVVSRSGFGLILGVGGNKKLDKAENKFCTTQLRYEDSTKFNYL